MFHEADGLNLFMQSVYSYLVRRIGRERKKATSLDLDPISESRRQTRTVDDSLPNTLFNNILFGP
jgi:hypothetical protein